MPLATPPLSPPSNPALFPARREEEEQGQGPAGRQAGRRAPGRAGAACHVGGAALPGCLCVPVPLQRPGQGVSREEEAGQLCRGEVAGSPPFPSPSSSYTWDGQRAELRLSLPPAAGGLAGGVPAGAAGTPQFPPSSQVQGSMTLLLASLSFSPHPCPAVRTPALLSVSLSSRGTFLPSPRAGMFGMAGKWLSPLCPTVSYLPLIRAMLCFPGHGHILAAPVVPLSLHSRDLCSMQGAQDRVASGSGVPQAPRGAPRLLPRLRQRMLSWLDAVPGQREVHPT